MDRFAVIGPTGLVGHANFYLFTRRCQKTNFCQKLALVACRVEDWLCTVDIDVEKLTDGPLLSAGEINSLQTHLRSIGPKALHDRTAAALRDNFYKPLSTASSNVYGQRLPEAADYLQSRLNAMVSKVVGNDLHRASSMIERIALALCSAVPRRINRPRTGLPRQEMEHLVRLTRTESPENPFGSQRAERVSLITDLLRELPLRAAEPLLTKIEDLAPIGSSATLWLHSRPHDVSDCRARRPSLKQEPRELPVSPDLQLRLWDYIQGTRARIIAHVMQSGSDGARRAATHNFIFVSDLGRPLSISALQKDFRDLRHNRGLSADFCPARLRNTFEDRFFERHRMEKRDQLAHLTGRSPNSRFFKHYANKAIVEDARIAASDAQRGARRSAP